MLAVSMTSKICTKCGLLKELSEYGVNSASRDGKRPECKECAKKRNRTKEQAKEYYNTHIENQLLAMAKQRAKKKKLEINIELSDIKIPEFCPLLGVKLERGTRKEKANAPSLDRIDPYKGYIKGNVWVISYMANAIKHNATPEEIIQVGKALEALKEKGEI